VTTGALILTQGILMVGHSAENITPESIMKDMDRSTLGKAWDWIKDVFTGRRLSLTFGKDMMSVAEFKDKVMVFAKDVMTGTPQTSPAKEIYAEATKVATSLGMAGNTDAIKKATIQAYVQNLGRENAGTDWTGVLSFFFIGANRDAISPTVLATKYSKFNEAEAKLTHRKLTSAELTAAGVKIEKENGKYKHIVPDTVQFAGDDAPVAVVKPAGIDFAAQDKVMDFHFSDRGDGKYTISLTESKTQPSATDPAPVIAPAGDVQPIKQASETVRVSRESKEGLSKNKLASDLYYVVGHGDKKLF
jgi:hypothetical protein